MAGEAGREITPRGPRRSQAQVTTIRKAIIIGSLMALLVGAASSLATARLTDRQSELDEQRAEIAQLGSRVSEQEAEIVRLGSIEGDGGATFDQLNDEIADLGDQLAVLESQEATYEEQVTMLESRNESLEEQVVGLESQNETFEEQVRTLRAENTSLRGQLSQIQNPEPGPEPVPWLTIISVSRRCIGCLDFVACVEIENISAPGIDIYYSSSQFTVIDGDGFVYPSRLHIPGYGIQLAQPLMDGQLSPGEKRRGELLYDVPEESIPTQVVWHVGVGDPPELSVDLPAVPHLNYSSFDNHC